MTIRTFLKALSSFVIFSLLLCLRVFASDDLQYWSRMTLKTWERNEFSLSTYGESRIMQDLSDVRLYLISEQALYHWHENLDLGMNYSYLSSKVQNNSLED